MARRGRRSAESPMSFFSFQDIITSVTGILILVTLLMSLELVTRAQVQSIPSPTNEELASVSQRVRRAQGEKDALSANNDSLQELLRKVGGVSRLTPGLQLQELSAANETLQRRLQSETEKLASLTAAVAQA